MPKIAHQDEGDQRRQRQHQRHRQRGAQVAEEQHQQHDHQQRCLDQGLLDRAHRLRRPGCGAVVERVDRTPGGRLGCELGELLPHPFDHLLRVGAAQPEHQPLHRLGLPLRVTAP
jgi:hypothetical protein